jgi:hypothetical protein
MGYLTHLFYPWGLILQVVAIVHFIRRRPDAYWLYIILFLGPVGAAVYLVAEALPDVVLARQSLEGLSRRKRIRNLEIAILDNPSVGNYEDLGELYMEDGKLQLAREAFGKAISARSDTLECFYRRGVCAIELGDAAGAVPDLERVVAKDPDHDFQRAGALLAHAYALTGQKDRSEKLFRRATELSTLSETYLNFADLLASDGRTAEARQWVQKVLQKQASMPHYIRRRERPWSQRARRTMKSLQDLEKSPARPSP